MTNSVETVPSNTDTVEMQVVVETTDAVGETRSYEVSITADMTIDSEHVLQGRRTDDDAPDEAAGGGVSNHAYDVASERFKQAGYEVYGR